MLLSEQTGGKFDVYLERKMSFIYKNLYYTCRQDRKSRTKRTIVDANMCGHSKRIKRYKEIIGVIKCCDVGQ